MRRLLLGLLAVCKLTKDAGSPLAVNTTDTHFLTSGSVAPAWRFQPANALVIAGEDYNPLVTVSYTGKVTLSPGVRPDEAAQAFWDAVERIGIQRCKAHQAEAQPHE